MRHYSDFSRFALDVETVGPLPDFAFSESETALLPSQEELNPEKVEHSRSFFSILFVKVVLLLKQRIFFVGLLLFPPKSETCGF